MYEQAGEVCDCTARMEAVEAVYSQLGCSPGSSEAYKLFHTRFHIIPEVTVNSLSW